MHSENRLEIRGSKLSNKDCFHFISDKSLQLKIGENVKQQMNQTYEYVKMVVENAKGRIYGVNTGFGALKDVYIKPEKAKKIQHNIILSHAAGVGDYFEPEIIRVAMLLQANALASGKSGVRYGVLERVVWLINHGITPCVPEQGSVGASGDLAPLSHIGLVTIGRGKAVYNNEIFEGSRLQQLLIEKGILELEWKDFELSYKEGLALVNGTYIMTAIALFALIEAENLVKHADVAACMSLEATLGHTRAFDKIVHETRPYIGQCESAENFRRLFLKKDATKKKLLLTSELLNKGENVHDCYSLRCAPQVHGTARETLRFLRKILEIEINAATDDPILFTAEEIAKPGMEPIDGMKSRLHYEEGNFHGQPIAVAMDTLGIAIASLGAISERRIQMLLDKNHNNGLPAQLVNNPDGINSGLMMSQHTTASLVAENNILSHPASVQSIPTSANHEDHVSMAPIAARQAREILKNVENILAIEFLCATHALCFRTKELTWTTTQENVNAEGKKFITGKPGTGSLAAMNNVKEAIQLVDGQDQELHDKISTIRNLIRERQILDAVESAIDDNPLL